MQKALALVGEVHCGEVLSASIQVIEIMVGDHKINEKADGKKITN